MTEEQTFLSAIMVNPDDQTAKLVYADWLNERDDPRAEIVRLKVQVATLADGWVEARQRLTELEAMAPARWLVLLDGPVWCLSGNIVPTRQAGPDGLETRHGTRLFKPNAKIYLSHLQDSFSILLDTPSEFERIQVVGRHRKSLDWIGCYLRPRWTTNWRVDLVYQPGPLVRLKKEGWDGFRLKRGEFACPEDKSSPEAVRGLLELLRAR